MGEGWEMQWRGLHWFKHNACTGIISGQKSHWTINRHLNNKEQGLKTGHEVGMGYTNKKGRIKEGSKEGEYVPSISEWI
jgi:hypothetical protein